MMRYLGLGIGHMNSAAFPGEAGAISAVPDPRYVVPAQREIPDNSISSTRLNPVPTAAPNTIATHQGTTTNGEASCREIEDEGTEEVPNDEEGDIEDGDLDEEDDNILLYDY